MRTVWKYEIDTTEIQTLQMPVGAEILCVQLQRTHICLWAEVDTGAPLKARVIYTCGTGTPQPPAPKRYIGTYQLFGGELVWHVYEGIDDEA